MGRLTIFVVVLVLLAGACASEAKPRSGTSVTSTSAALDRGPAAAQRTFFVAPNGHDDAPGSRANPWKRLGTALTRLRAGDRLVVRDGVYPERIKVRVAPGGPERRIVVQAAPAERPLVVGQLWIADARYWTVDGISVTWGPRNPPEPMVRMYGGTDWALRNGEFFGARSTSALHVDDGPRNDLGTWEVTGNCIHDTAATNGANQDHNLYVDDMSGSPNPHGLIARNILFGAPNGRGIKLGPGGSEGGARNVVVRNNTLFGQMENISVSQATTGVTITRNFLIGARRSTLHAFQLRGTGNVAYDNVTGLTPRFVDRTAGTSTIADRDNHRDIDPGFDQVKCDGFHPSTWRDYGRYG